MKNPWNEFKEKLIDFEIENKDYLLKDDSETIRKFNESFKSDKIKELYQVHQEVHPYPYTGNIKKAEVILLATNPGFVDEEVETLYKNKSFQKECVENLFFQNNYFVNNDKERVKYGDYWIKRTKKLKADIGEENYNKIGLMQFFPYHTKKYRKIAKKYFSGDQKYLKSQEFNFYLIRQFIKEGKLFIITRSKKEWYKAIPELADYKEKGGVFEIRNYRQPYITPNNFIDKNAYEKIVKKICN